MIETSQKTSLLVKYQLPEFIRDNPSYSKFVEFLQRYYEWTEQNDNIYDRSKNLLNYQDIDNTSNEFLQYFYNDLLPYFPTEIAADKQKVLKIAKELYKTKGTPNSYKFLFRAFYNSDVDIFYTKDAVLRASSGKWYVPKSLKLATEDRNFLSTNNLRIFGETSKSIATIENSVVAGTKTEIFISNIERLFQSGENVRIVDNNNQSVYFLDGKIVQPDTPGAEILRAKLVGQISSVNIDSKNRGTLYRVGDPVVFYGGLNSITGHGAAASIGSVTSGSIQRVLIVTGGYGYTEAPNTVIDVTNAPGAILTVGSVDTTQPANATFVPTDSINLSVNTTIGNTQYSFFSNNITANANTKLSDAFEFLSYTTYPISSVIVQNGGGGIFNPPIVTARSLFSNNISRLAGFLPQNNLAGIGILAPVVIENGGSGYVANDTIIFSGGSGTGAFANVTNVSSNGTITQVDYVYDGNIVDYPLGGFGYKIDNLPTLSVVSANAQAYGAVLSVPGILGDGATFSVQTDRVGAITTINVSDFGEDYVAAPNVSLRIQDMVVSNLSISLLPQKDDIVYQGTSYNTSSYHANVASVNLLVSDDDPRKSLYNLRVYNYTSTPNTSLTLNTNSGVVMNTSSYPYANSVGYNADGLRTYGDGTAKAVAKFLNGLTIGQGQYLDTTGQPSSFNLLQNQEYNNYTYKLTVEKEIAKYREPLLNLLHPTGTHVIGRYAVKSFANVTPYVTDTMTRGHTLAYYVDAVGSYATMQTDFVNQSNNIITLHNLKPTTNISTFINSDNWIELNSETGPNVYSQVISVNATSNTIIIKDNVWLTFANVAYVTGNSGSNVINITSLTGSYDIINNGNYSNTTYPLHDIVFAGDVILVANNTQKTVSGVDYDAGLLFLSSNLTANANSLMSVNRTANTTNVKIFATNQ